MKGKEIEDEDEKEDEDENKTRMWWNGCRTETDRLEALSHCDLDLPGRCFR